MLGLMRLLHKRGENWRNTEEGHHFLGSAETVSCDGRQIQVRVLVKSRNVKLSPAQESTAPMLMARPVWLEEAPLWKCWNLTLEADSEPYVRGLLMDLYFCFIYLKNVYGQ